MHLSKRTLGEVYLTGTGIILAGMLLLMGALSVRTNPIQAAVLGSTAIPAAALASTEFWLRRSHVDDDQVWTIAQWGGFGIGLTTLVNILILEFYQAGTTEPAWVVAALFGNVATDGVAGVLVGGLITHGQKTRRLSAKNAVLNRVL